MRTAWLVIAMVVTLFLIAGCASGSKGGSIPATFNGTVAVGYADPDFKMEPGLEGCKKEVILKGLDDIALQTTARATILLSEKFKNITFKDVGDIDVRNDPYEQYMVKKIRIMSTTGSQTMVWGTGKDPVCKWDFAVGINEIPSIDPNTLKIIYDKGAPKTDYAIIIWPISLFTFTSFYTSDSTGSFAYGMFDTATGAMIFGGISAKEVNTCLESCGSKMVEAMASKVVKEMGKRMAK